MTLADLYRTYVLDLDPILADMTAHGVCVDRERQDKLKIQVAEEIAELTARAQSLVPSALWPRKRYKKFQEEVGRTFEPVGVDGQLKCCDRCGAPASNKSEHQKGKGNPCKGAGTVLTSCLVTEWDEILPFNPLSTDQLADYCAWAKHKQGTNIKTGRPTLNDKHLRKLAATHGDKHPIYQLSLDLRARQKVSSTYIDGFAPNRDGRITGTFVHSAETMRLQQRRVSLMNVSKRGKALYAKEIRRTIRPSPGCVFVGADSSSIEAIMTGWFAGDENLQRISKSGGVHAYTACHELGWEFTTANVARVKSEHKQLYDRCKTITYLTSFGGGPYMMHKSFPEDFPTVNSAKRAQALLFTLFPALGEWRTRIKIQAQHDAFLTNPFGFRNYFYNVLRRDQQTGQWIDGEDSSDAIAFLPQSTAAFFGRGNLKRIGASWARPYMPANGFCHDGYILDVPTARAREALELLAGILTRPIPEMGGLTIPCELEMGDDWASMEPAGVVNA